MVAVHWAHSEPVGQPRRRPTNYRVLKVTPPDIRHVTATGSPPSLQPDFLCRAQLAGRWSQRRQLSDWIAKQHVFPEPCERRHPCIRRAHAYRGTVHWSMVAGGSPPCGGLARKLKPQCRVREGRGVRGEGGGGGGRGAVAHLSRSAALQPPPSYHASCIDARSLVRRGHSSRGLEATHGLLREF